MITGALLLFAQAATTAATLPAALPDIELRARVEARRVEIERESPITVSLLAEPGITDTKVERSQPGGARTYRNLIIDTRLVAALTQDAPPIIDSDTGSTGEPQ